MCRHAGVTKRFDSQHEGRMRNMTGFMLNHRKEVRREAFECASSVSAWRESAWRPGNVRSKGEEERRKGSKGSGARGTTGQARRAAE
eukprot:6195941-Pleurochrysis_carterae.AAC.1